MHLRIQFQDPFASSEISETETFGHIGEVDGKCAVIGHIYFFTYGKSHIFRTFELLKRADAGLCREIIGIGRNID